MQQKTRLQWGPLINVVKNWYTERLAGLIANIANQMANASDLVVTMGCGAADICPGPFFTETVDWGLEDPKGQPLEKVREIRDEIERRVKELIAQKAPT